MGQPIQILTMTVVDAIAMFTTDRGVTGQQGVSVARGEEAGEGFASLLARKVLEADSGVDHVFVASNQVVARRSEGWDDTLTAQIADVITGFFVYYDGTDRP